MPMMVMTGQQRVAQRVPAHDQLLEHALGARGAHVVLAQHLEHGRAGHARGHRRIAIAGGERRPDQHAQVVDRIDPDRHVGDGRHPRHAEPGLRRDQDAEDDQDAEPERRHGDAGDGEGPHHVVDPGILLHGRDGAERDGEQDGGHRRHDRDLQRQLEAQADLLDDRPPGPHRLAEVEGGEALDEAEELHGHRLIGADLRPAVAQDLRIDAAAAGREPEHADVAGDEAHQAGRRALPPRTASGSSAARA